MKVRVFGEILERARPLTIFCSSQPLPLPKARVQVIASDQFISDEGEVGKRQERETAGSSAALGMTISFRNCLRNKDCLRKADAGGGGWEPMS